MVNFINKDQAKNKNYILKVLQSVKLPFVVTDINDFEVLTGGSKSEMVDIDKATISRADDWNYTNSAKWNYETAKTLLQARNINLDNFKTVFNNDDKVICHNDLSGSNILLDDKQDSPLQAIIDFGNVAVMPRSNEFVPFYKISRNLAHKIMDCYNQISPKAVNKKEVDYKVLSFIGQVLIENQNKENFFANLMIDNFKS